MNGNLRLSNEIWEASWPSEGLENLGYCPVCNCLHRALLHDNLIDNVFFCALGKWTMWRCEGCRCGYLDPRPNRDTLQLAYTTYYTHQKLAEKGDYASLSSFRKLRRRLVNGYTNWRFLTCEMPATRIGVLALMVAWPLKIRLEREYRNLPRLPASGGTLLDVGCGSGDFLQTARSCGWNVVGIEPDPNAVANGLNQGLNVILGGVEKFDGKENLFDVITLNHVIEHLHDPIAVLKACHRLLKPAGQLWLETPNIDSLGHRQYRKNWRGLESPRHLVLFNPKALAAALNCAGFTEIDAKFGPSPLLSMTKASEAILQGLPIDSDIQLSARQKWNILTSRLLQTLFPSCKEFLTVVAMKPSFQARRGS